MKNYDYTILPEYSPLYPKLPYEYKDYQKVSVYCRGDVDVLAKFLPKEFKPTSDIFEVFILKNNEIEGLEPYSEGGIVIPCAYKDIKGACVSFEYVDTDDALCAGREIWGYPKKLSEVEYEQNDKGVKGSVTRNGKKIIDIEFNFEDKEFSVPNFSPRLQVKRMPHVEEHGVGINKIIKNELTNAEIKKKIFGNAKVVMNESNDDPLYMLEVKEVIGAVYIEGAFTLTYGEVVEDLMNSN